MSAREIGKVPKEKILDVGLESAQEEEMYLWRVCREGGGMHDAETCEGLKAVQHG